MLAKRDRLPVGEMLSRRAARTASSPLLTIKQFLPPRSGGRPRVGVIAGKSVAPGAVARNRLRRVIFDASRSHMDYLLPGDYLIIMKKEAAGLPRRDLEREVRGVLEQFACPTDKPQLKNQISKPKT